MAASKLKAKGSRKKAAVKEKVIKQYVFLWEGKNKAGTVSKGEMTAASETTVRALLRRQQINPTKVKKRTAPLLSIGGEGQPVTAGDIALFARQLATMMSSGVPLVQAFEIVGRGHEKKSMERLILSIKSDVEGGSTLAEALRKNPQHFDALFCNLVEAGEQAGILEDLLHKIATYKEKTESMKKKIKKALTYPIAIIIVAFVITAILMIFVVPVFADMFRDFGAELPGLTQFIVTLSDAFVDYWYIIFGCVGGFVFVFLEIKKRSVKFQHILQRLSLKLPVFGELLTKSAISRFARTLSTMFAAGTPLVEALVSVAGATGNIVFYEATMKVRDDVSSGTQLNVSMKTTGIFPNMVVQMVTIGEEAGSIDAMLGKVADYYEEEVDNLVDAMSSLIEPVIMAFLGVVIGGLVVGMYLPIFKMGQVV
ncbi:MAG: type II secretion system F family protein [Gammaproteobacteria bacterium]|nr:type II secretion system F family protein [Gammaproteobacteria bacterium]